MRISDWSSDVVLFRSPGGGAVKRLLSIASLLAILSTPALAEDTPRGGPADPRVKFVEYQETQVYRIVGPFRTATQVVLGADETLETVTHGDTVSWEVAERERAPCREKG